MSIVEIGLSHRRCDGALLGGAAVAADDLAEVLRRLRGHPAVLEALVLSTCNRVEVYLVADDVVAATRHATDLFALRTGGARELAEALDVRDEAGATRHLFAVACGLDSVAVGEDQIVAQIRTALRAAREAGALGPTLGALVDAALRTSRRARTRTGVGAAGRTIVHMGLDAARAELGGLAGRTAVLLGAGATATLAARLLRADGAGDLWIANRTEEAARRLAAQVRGRPVPAGELVPALARADLVVAATGAPHAVVGRRELARARELAGPRPVVVLDLAVPHDVAPECRELPGVTLLDIAALARTATGAECATEVDRAWAVVVAGAEEFLARRGAAAATPVIVALRSLAQGVVDDELRRLRARLPHLDDRERTETATAVRRVVGKLLHKPMTRAKELSTSPHGHVYVEALSRLFDLNTEEMIA
ncbi:glutamyl-tRNA reductase [Streptoalloteichus hindustanus]|uniref:Glutamyl-tRNA reductase n=1 Tax=Streptoalloteichus hindustanus TaxID=2017 RepID=A0A1M5PQ09_STRHI|nr:glutamyl-tRNA reductase [Streptoalloteichus hindustanus]SHH03955.1 glutamyl-tRNA reductase [Streptoalloteichus hindustanus]